MEKEFRKILKQTSKVKLSRAEKQKMRANLSAFIERNPVIAEAPFRWSLFPQMALRPVPVLALFGMLLLAGAGTSLAAESALPGEALYPVKVGINEKVRTVFAISDEAEATLAARLAERRLQEASELAIKGELTDETRAEIESRLEVHVAKFEEKAAKLAGKGKAAVAAEISSNLEASFNAHGQVIASVKYKDKDDEDSQVKVVQPFLIMIQKKLGTVQKTRASAEANVSGDLKPGVEVAAEGKLKAAINKIAEARGAVERTRGSVSATTTAEAEARLTLAEDAIKGGKVKLEADAFSEAFASFEMAHRLAQEAQLLINASYRFKIDLDTGNKYGNCSLPMPAMPNWICPDGTTAGPACEDGRWTIKQCPSKQSETSAESENKLQGETQSWLNKLGL